LNSFKKYPKLSLLFIIRTLLILVLIYSNFYFRSSINNEVDKISLLKKGNTDFSKHYYFSELIEIKDEINSNIDYLLYIQLIIIVLLFLIKKKTDKENKKLDEIESK